MVASFVGWRSRSAAAPTALPVRRSTRVKIVRPRTAPRPACRDCACSDTVLPASKPNASGGGTGPTMWVGRGHGRRSGRLRHSRIGRLRPALQSRSSGFGCRAALLRRSSSPRATGVGMSPGSRAEPGIPREPGIRVGRAAMGSDRARNARGLGGDAPASTRPSPGGPRDSWPESVERLLGLGREAVTHC